MWPDDLLMLERPLTHEEAERNAWQTEGMFEHHLQRSLWNRHRSGARIMLPNYTPIGWYECDLYIVTNRYYAIEYEIKLSLADFKADSRKRDKHVRLAQRTGSTTPTRFFYAVPAMLVSPRDVPDYAGLVYFRWSAKEPGRRLVAPLCTVIRQAPRLNDHKRTDKTINVMRRTSYWRFWHERFAFDDYRRDTMRGNWAQA